MDKNAVRFRNQLYKYIQIMPLIQFAFNLEFLLSFATWTWRRPDQSCYSYKEKYSKSKMKSAIAIIGVLLILAIFVIMSTINWFSNDL